ncbi:hypothetical protein CPB86DRAFT_184702 [Serendipita vermifera]|nr:hypothetical protein CPB86DRAFT_184702 [Serendipita vermifera]
MDIDGSNGFLYYLHQIAITPIKSAYRVKLRVDGSDVGLTENKPKSTWNLANSVEVTEASKVTVTLKTGYKVAGISLGREECVVEISTREAIKELLDTMESEISISEQATFLHQPLTIVLSLRPEKIRRFEDDFDRFFKDLNRAVDVERPKIARRIGEDDQLPRCSPRLCTYPMMPVQKVPIHHSPPRYDHRAPPIQPLYGNHVPRGRPKRVPSPTYVQTCWR